MSSPLDAADPSSPGDEHAETALAYLTPSRTERLCPDCYTWHAGPCL